MKIKVSVLNTGLDNQETLKEFVEKIEKEYGERHTLEWEIQIVEPKGI